jgi:hypothetical protein
MNPYPVVPIGVIGRTLVLELRKTIVVLLDATATWESPERLVVRLPGREFVFRPLTREQLVARWGEERIGEAVEGWLVDDSRLVLVQPGGGTVQWHYDPAAVDRAAAALLELVQREKDVPAASAA